MTVLLLCIHDDDDGDCSYHVLSVNHTHAHTLLLNRSIFQMISEKLHAHRHTHQLYDKCQFEFVLGSDFNSTQFQLAFGILKKGFAVQTDKKITGI